MLKHKARRYTTSTGPTIRLSRKQRSAQSIQNEANAVAQEVRYIFLRRTSDKHLLSELAQRLLNVGAGRLMGRPNQREELEILAFERFSAWLTQRGFYLSREAAEQLARSKARWKRMPREAIGDAATPIAERMQHSAEVTGRVDERASRGALTSRLDRSASIVQEGERKRLARELPPSGRAASLPSDESRSRPEGRTRLPLDLPTTRVARASREAVAVLKARLNHRLRPVYPVVFIEPLSATNGGEVALGSGFGCMALA